MPIKHRPDIPASAITPEAVFHSRRRFVKELALAAGAGFAAPAALANVPYEGRTSELGEALTPESIVTSYNNFYEFGTDKDDPAKYAHEMTTDPWTVEVKGEAAKTGQFAYEDLIKGLPEEERIYRFRCVEAWSMVVPWTGIPLKRLLAQFQPNGNAKYVEFTTLHRPDEMRGQTLPVQQHRLALRRGPALRRGLPSVGADGHRRLWARTAQPKRSALAPDGALEVRFQVLKSSSSRYASPGGSRATPGTCWRRRSTASTPTSTRRWTTPAGAKPLNAACPAPCSTPTASPPCPSTATPNRWRGFTPGWI